MKKIIISAIAVLAITTACYKDNFRERHPSQSSSGCDTTSVISYSKDIAPIMSKNCNQNCHNPTAPTGSRNLSNYSGVSSGALNGNNPGDGGSLYSSVSWDNVNTTWHMPQGGSKLSACDITKIKKWAVAGAPNN